ncbi:MAG: SurA N-terminal domain-containing protein [Omnitrophica bacterium]|nr:SurA N-terminal domain-containing protein [Candidatus Omnitrophota bacterium]
MLTSFRTKHMKKTLWFLAIVISVVFILSGGSGLLRRGRQKEFIATINGRKISTSTLHHYHKMAQLYLITHSQEDRNFKQQDIENLGVDFLLLNLRAKKEKIKVTDKEVVEYVMINFFPGGKFNQTDYTNFVNFISSRYNLGLTVRSFEEYIREFIKIDKLFARHINAEATDEEARDLYIKETQKAKINYLFIPYKKFKGDTKISKNEIEEFYENNKNLFQQEAKVNMRYLFIRDDNEHKDEIIKAASQIKALDELKDKFFLKIKMTGFIGLGDPIEGIGWQPQLNKIAFSLKEKELSPLIKSEKGLIIMEKFQEQPISIVALSQTTKKVKEKIIEERVKEKAKKYAQTILDLIKKKKLKNFKKVASRRKNVEFKETDYFKFYDYIAGIGLDRNISRIIFSLEKGRMHPQILPLINGICIIRLAEITEVSEEDFEEKLQVYLNKIKQNKMILERVKFLSQLQKESNLKLLTLQ